MLWSERFSLNSSQIVSFVGAISEAIILTLILNGTKSASKFNANLVPYLQLSIIKKVPQYSIFNADLMFFLSKWCQHQNAKIFSWVPARLPKNLQKKTYVTVQNI